MDVRRLLLTASVGMVVLAVLPAADDEPKAIVGVRYDKCRVFELKREYRDSEYTLFDKSGKLRKDIVADSRLLLVAEEDEIRKVLNDLDSMFEGSCDCRLVPFVLVFYRGSERVLEVFPNVTGGDFWTVPKTKLTGKSPIDAAWGRLLRACYHTIVHGRRD